MMSVKEVLEKYRESPINESLRPVAESLADTEILVAIQELEGGGLAFQVGEDVDANLWLYAFTDEDEFARMFPDGGQFGQFNFRELLHMVDADEHFSGIFLNSRSESSYVIPRELFEPFQAILAPRDA